MKNKKKRRWLIAGFGILCALIAVFALNPDRFPGGPFIVQKLRRKATVSDRLAEYGPQVRTRWQPYFARKGVIYPPQKLLFVGLKREKQLEVYAANAGQPLELIRSLPIQGLSGKSGPKLREGDLQAPEGFYRIESLNPNSAFHLALRVNYPNDFDLAQAQKEGRTDLGGDIMIHGSNGSVGCLAMGDEAAEELFVLAAETGIEKIEVLLSPVDFRTNEAPPDAKRPQWASALYNDIKTALLKLPPQ